MNLKASISRRRTQYWAKIVICRIYRLVSCVAGFTPGRVLWILSLCCMVSACQNPPRSFASMTEEELFAYNRGQPILKQVYCVREATSSSYIKKRRCRSVEDWVEHNNRAAMTLDVLDVGGDSYNLPDSINDGRIR